MRRAAARGDLRRPLDHGVECRQPVAFGRLERDPVVERGARRPDVRLAQVGEGTRARPAPAVEVLQHQHAEIAQLRRRHVALEPDPEGRVIRLRQLRDVARTHLVVNAGGVLRGRRRDGPEPSFDPRHEQEQHRGQRHAEGERVGGEAQRADFGVRLDRPMDARQRRRQQPHDQQGVGKPDEALLVQQRCDAHEVADEHEHCVVARRTCLGELQGRHDGEQRGAGIEAVERPVAGHDGGGRRGRGRQPQHARRHRPAALARRRAAN